jgi:alkylated DNA repair dioxygenase AlkB
MEAECVAPGIYYFARFVSEPDVAFDDVMEQVSFTQRERTLYGRKVATPRLEAWHGSIPYRFGGSALPAAELPPVLAALAVRAQCVIKGASFDTCLVNLYRDGRDSVGWHADDEPEMGDPIIASVSLGAARDFCLRRKPDHRDSAKAARLAGAPWGSSDNVRVTLEHGSMLVMYRGVQAEWEHSLPKVAACGEPRINLTFRDCSRESGR